MHGSQDRQTYVDDEETFNWVVRFRLIGADPSSTCLRCHAEKGQIYNVLSKDGSAYTPGGDFYWLKRTFTWTADGKTQESGADNHGHNVIAAEYGLRPDSTLASAPGGQYSASALGCNSCHDPHGKRRYIRNYGNSAFGSYDERLPDEPTEDNYMLLGGVDYKGGSRSGGIRFRHPAPFAAAPSDNRTETDSNHTAYGSGMSEWCSNCHPNFLNGGKMHPSGERGNMTGPIASNYNSYIKTGDLTGTQESAYLALVPFESGTRDKNLLDPSSTSGPDGSSNVMCLTCHRAHASAFRDIGRWDFSATFIADSHPRPGDGGATGSDALNSYYGRNMVDEFGESQRSLCNKCHVMD